MEATHASRPALRVTTLCLAAGLLSATVFLLLRSDVTHEYDLYWMLPKLRDADLDDVRHPLAFRLAWMWTEALAGFGSLHERLRLANALSSAIAVGMFPAVAVAWRAPWRAAAAGAAVFALLPVTVRFATVAELHGLFLPFAALVLWQLGRVLAQGMQPAPAALLGLLCGVATGVHATGHLMVGLSLEWVVTTWWGRCRATQLVAGCVALVLAHGAVTWSLRFATGGDVTADPATQQLTWFSALPWTVDGAGALAWGEYAWPLLPLSLLWPLAALRLSGRAKFAALVTLGGATLVYLACCQKMLSWPRYGYLLHEQGSYLLPLACSAALVSARALAPRTLVLVALAAALASGYAFATHARGAVEPALVAAAVRYLEEQDVRLVAGDEDEFEALFDALYEDPSQDEVWRRVVLYDQLVFESRRTTDDIDPRQLAMYFHPVAHDGRATALTSRALTRMRASEGAFGEAARTWLPKFFELRAVGAGPFEATLLSPRPR
jgi:hypothetical protein